MKILILGYGKMGQYIEQLAKNRSHEIVGCIDNKNKDQLAQYNGSNVDVAIEFSQPEAAVRNISYCLENDIPILSGTTGWLHEKSKMDNLCAANNGTFFYASNYSIGVNIFFKLNNYLAEMMDNFESYEVSINEIHHTQKKDAPSGTAITLAEGILKKINRLKEWKLGEKGDSILPVTAARKDDVPGTHEVLYHSTIDDIEIKHTAHSREGFAKGAVLVAEWLKDQKGVLSMDDYLKF